MKAVTGRLVAAGFGLVLGVGLALWGSQHVASKHECKMLDRDIEKVTTRVETGLMVKRDLPRVEEEIRECEAEYHDLSRALPDYLVEGEYLAAIHEIANEADVGLVVADEGGDHGAHGSALFSSRGLVVEVTGDAGAVDDFLGRVRAGDRLTVVEHVEESEESTRVALRTFAMSWRFFESLPNTEAVNCEVPEYTQVWLPPYSWQVAERRTHLRGAWATASDLKPFVDVASRRGICREAVALKRKALEQLALHK